MPNNQYDTDIPVLEDLVLVDVPEHDFEDDEGLKAEHNPASAEAELAVSTPVTETLAGSATDFSSKFSFASPPESKPLPRDNPFLPYEHLEQLARERLEFQRQFSEFTLSQQAYQAQHAQQAKANQVSEPAPVSWRPISTSQGASAPTTNQMLLLDNLARQMTHEVINELRPQIEKRVRELLDERFSELSALLPRRN